MQDFLSGTGCLLLYYLVCASTALISHKLFPIPTEVFRKLLHCILLGSAAVCIFAFEFWYTAVLFCIFFEAAVYPVLSFFERFRTYSETVTERSKGELKQSLLLVFSMFAVVIAVTWGWLGDRYLTLASIFAWGIGDAAAALIGKRFGRHKFPNSRKSLEGTFSMFAFSFLSVAVILCLRGGMSLPAVGITAALVGAVSAAAELYTPGGLDTVTCPLASMAVLLPLVHFFGGGI